MLQGPLSAVPRRVPRISALSGLWTYTMRWDTTEVVPFEDGCNEILGTSQTRKTPKSLIYLGVLGLCETSWDVFKSSSGGAGGNRTPVRKPSPGRSTRLA